jgi:NitT/TauT family transport system substrate-binding protein
MGKGVLQRLLKCMAVLLVFVSLASFANGCTAKPPADKVSVRIAMLPILDTIPLYLAQDAGYFTAEGVSVEFIPVGSAAERDQVMAAGRADGMINDLVSVVLYNRQEITVQVVRFMRIATHETPLYRVVASPKAGITTVAGLAGVPIGISQGSIIDYVTDQLLQSEGLAPDQIKTIAVPKIPERMAMLSSGGLQAATLPEPFATLAIQNGAVVITDDRVHPEFGNSVISFHKSFLDQHPTAVQRFLRAVEKAVQEINASPEKGRPIFTKYNLVPSELAASYTVPTFPQSSLPTLAQFDAVAQWAVTKGLVDRIVPYAGSVVDNFLVKP